MIPLMLAGMAGQAAGGIVQSILGFVQQQQQTEATAAMQKRSHENEQRSLDKMLNMNDRNNAANASMLETLRGVDFGAGSGRSSV